MNEYIVKYKNLNIAGKLVVINVAVWLLTQVGRLVCYLITNEDLPWESALALHGDFQSFLYTPWTIVTYFFVHANFGQNVFHLLFNMLWLWWFGQFFLRWHTSKQLLEVYMLGGVFAGLIFLTSYNLVPGLSDQPNTLVAGASGAIFALVAAVAVRQPDEPLYLNFFVRIIPVKMKWFALFALALNLMNLADGLNVGGIICHLGGATWGVLYELNEKVFHLSFNRFSFSFRPKMKATKGGRHTMPNDRQKDHDYNQRQRDHQQQVDAILDKISRSGYNGLTAEEKALLFDASHRRKS